MPRDFFETVNLRHSTMFMVFSKTRGSLENFSFNPKNKINYDFLLKIVLNFFYLRIINKVIVLIVTNLNIVQLKNKISLKLTVSILNFSNLGSIQKSK